MEKLKQWAMVNPMGPKSLARTQVQARKTAVMADIRRLYLSTWAEVMALNT